MRERGMQAYEGNDLAALLRDLGRAHANDAGWPLCKGKYVEYPGFRREWRAYRRTYHTHVRDKLVCRTLAEKCLSATVKEELEKG
jgi:hypothetical protein